MFILKVYSRYFHWLFYLFWSVWVSDVDKEAYCSWPLASRLALTFDKNYLVGSVTVRFTVVPDKLRLCQFKLYFKGYQDNQLEFIKIINVMNVLTKQEKEMLSKVVGTCTLT